MINTTKEKTEAIIKWLDEKSIGNIKQIDLTEISVDMDIFVIGTALNERHCKSVAEYIDEKCGESDILICGIEGADTGRWILIDCSDIVVHLFIKEERERYALEKLWSEGKMLSVTPKQN